MSPERVRYFYPQDVVVRSVEGKRVAYVDFTLPCTWTEAASYRAKKDFLDGWCMARRAYEQAQTDKMLQDQYPQYFQEKVEYKRQFRQWKDWVESLLSKGITVNTPEYRLEKLNYKRKHF